MIVFAETRDKVGMLEVPEGCLDNRPLYWVNESGMEAYHLVQRGGFIFTVGVILLESFLGDEVGLTYGDASKYTVPFSQETVFRWSCCAIYVGWVPM